MVKWRHYVLLIGEQASVSTPSVFYLLSAARILNASDLTLVTFGYSIYVIIGTLYDAILLEPLLIIISEHERNGTRYAAVIWRINLVVTVISLGAYVVLWHASDASVVRALALAAGFLPSIIVINTLRKVLNARDRIAWSGLASFTYSGVFAVIVILLYVSRNFTAAFAPAPFLISALVFALIAWRAALSSEGDSLPPNVTIYDHFQLAWPTAIYTVCANLTFNIYPFIFAALSDGPSIVTFRLVTLVLTPFFQLWAAVYSFNLPRLQVSAVREINLTTLCVLLFIVVAPLGTALLCLGWGQEIASGLFGTRYAVVGQILPIALVGASVSIALNTVGMWFKTHRQLAALRSAGIFQLLVTIGMALPMASSYGTSGAFLTFALANGAALVLAGYLYLRSNCHFGGRKLWSR